MRNVLKATTIENKLPLLAVEEGCIISKDADVTVCYEVTLPELYTVTSAEYETMHSYWCKAIRVLPDFTVVHKQDWFLRESYRPELSGEGRSFLQRSFELHFNERPYLNHRCYLFLTKTTKERSRQQSNFTTLCRGHIIPKEVNVETAQKFLEAAEQFERIMNDSGFITLRRLTDDEIVGTAEAKGIVEQYMTLDSDGTATLEDIDLDPKEMCVGDKRVCLFTLSDTEDLPTRVATDIRYERLSTDRSDCRLSFASPVGLLLSCNHIYNQYLFVDNSEENLQQFEKTSRNMQSLSRYSRSNAINSQWIEEYLNEAHSGGLTSVMAWSDDEQELKRIKNDMGSQIASMECMPRHNTVDCPTLFWAGIPGNAADFPAEEAFYTFPEQTVCFFTEETNYRSSLSPFGIKMVDRLTGKPLHIDISDLPMKKGVTTNRNKFVLGPSGSGKSFFMNHLVRQYYEQGTHVVLIDTGNSYFGLCNLIHRLTKGEDGVYFTYTDDNPIAFNPFYTADKVFDIEKRESIKTLLLTLWKKDNEPATRSEEVALSNAVSMFIDRLKADDDIEPSFNTFYEFVRTEYRQELERKHVREKDFDIDGFLNVLEPYYRGGEYDYLLNSDKQLDLLSKRFIVFEIDAIKDHPILFPVTTIIIMELFINKMRRLNGVRKMIVIEEAWKAIASANMASYIKYLYKTVRKFFGEAIVVTQEVDDIISSPIVKESIINNSDCKILLDQRKYMNKFDQIQALLGLTDKDTEVSPEEYLAYTTEETEKMEVQALADELGGDMELAIKRLADERRNRQ